MTRFELVTTKGRFLELENAWDRLWQDAGVTAFSSHAWLVAWVTHVDRFYRLRIGLIWHDDDTLAAVLPLAVHTRFGVRILEWAGEAVCDYCDGIGHPEDLQAAWIAIRDKRGFDLVRLKHIQMESQIANLFGPHRLVYDNTCLKVICEWESGDVWFRTLNKKKRNNFSRGQRILEESGNTSILCHQGVPDTALVQRLVELKMDWLKATKQSSDLLDEKHPDRLMSLVQALAKINRLRIFMITCGDDIVSASINISDGASIRAFFAVYNPRFDRASPGIMLMTAYTRWAFNNGFTEIDYLRGAEDYKWEFANNQVSLSAFVEPVSLRGRAALLIRRTMNEVRKLRARNKAFVRTGSAYTTRAGTARAVPVDE